MGWIKKAIMIVSAKYERHGLRAAVIFLFHITVNRFLSFNVVKGVHLSKGRYVPVDVPRRAECRTELLSRADLLALSDSSEHEMTSLFIEQSFAFGNRCIGVICDGRLASYSWFSCRQTEMNEAISIRFRDDYLYMYKSFTHPDFRGQRLLALVIEDALARFYGAGCKGIIAAIEYTNFSSLASFYRAGFRDFGRFFLARVFGRYFTVATPGCRPFGFGAFVTPRSEPLPGTLRPDTQGAFLHR